MNETRKESFTRYFKFPFRDTLNKAVEHFSFAERVLFFILGITLVLSAVVIILRLNDYLLVEVPTEGGAITEGIIGSPRFINPLFAISDADRDLTSLVYSGLLKTSSLGTLVPDLAKNYTISEDGLTYTFTLKDGIFFHDGTPVTTDDVEFTVLKAQDSALKSPKRASWDSVRVERVSDKEIRFILKQPYAPFLENTTLGILPKHIWKNVPPEEFALSFFNIEPIGSGPFMIDTINRNSSGIPEHYTLSPFKNYALGKPYLNTLTIAFYPNEQTLIEAFKRGDIESVNSIAPEEVANLSLQDEILMTTPLSRIFAVFFNQNEVALFSNIAVRRALDTSLDKEEIVKKVLSGFGVVADGPIPKGFASNTQTQATIGTTTGDKILDAREILEKDGWKLNADGIYEKADKDKKKALQVLSFSLTTSNAPELKKAASLLKETWEKLGAKVEIRFFEPGDLSQNIIRPRKYDALLFGEIIGRDLDLFAFWHSSQRNDPGLNIALYTNTKTDKLLSDARTISDPVKQLEKYRQFEVELKKDTPVVFLYSPTFIYTVPKKLKGVGLGHLTVPAERFSNVSNWYIETEKIWKVFMNNRNNTQ